MKRPLAWVRIASGLVFPIGGTSLWRAGSSRHPAPLRLPASLADLPLSARTEGSAAIAEIGRMHAADLALDSASIGRYGDAGQVVLWISQLPDSTAAFDMTEAMRTRINAVDSPFTQLALRPRQAGPITELEGMGQRHYLYASGSTVLWLGAEPALAEQALVNLQEMYP